MRFKILLLIPLISLLLELLCFIPFAIVHGIYATVPEGWAIGFVISLFMVGVWAMCEIIGEVYNQLKQK